MYSAADFLQDLTLFTLALILSSVLGILVRARRATQRLRLTRQTMADQLFESLGLTPFEGLPEEAAAASGRCDGLEVMVDLGRHFMLTHQMPSMLITIRLYGAASQLRGQLHAARPMLERPWGALGLPAARAYALDEPLGSSLTLCGEHDDALLACWAPARQALGALISPLDGLAPEDLVLDQGAMHVFKVLTPLDDAQELARYVQRATRAAAALCCRPDQARPRLRQMVRQEPTIEGRAQAARRLLQMTPSQDPSQDQDQDLRAELSASHDDALRLLELELLQAQRPLTSDERRALEAILASQLPPGGQPARRPWIDHLARHHAALVLGQLTWPIALRAQLLGALLRLELTDALEPLLRDALLEPDPLSRERLLGELVTAATPCLRAQPALLERLAQWRTMRQSELMMTLDALSRAWDAQALPALHALLEDDDLLGAFSGVTQRALQLLVERRDASSARVIAQRLSALKAASPQRLEQRALIQPLERALKQIAAHHAQTNHGALSLSVEEGALGALSLAVHQGGELTPLTPEELTR